MQIGIPNIIVGCIDIIVAMIPMIYILWNGEIFAKELQKKEIERYIREDIDIQERVLFSEGRQQLFTYTLLRCLVLIAAISLIGAVPVLKSQILHCALFAGLLATSIYGLNFVIGYIVVTNENIYLRSFPSKFSVCRIPKTDIASAHANFSSVQYGGTHWDVLLSTNDGKWFTYQTTNNPEQMLRAIRSF